MDRLIDGPTGDSDPDHRPGSGGDVLPLGVHVLSEFIFCPRAGLLAYEQKSRDNGEESDRTPQLDFLPDFNVALIEQELDRVKNRLFGVLTFASPVIVALLIIALVHFITAVVLVIGSLCFVPWLHSQVQAFFLLRHRLQLAVRAAAHEPDANLTAIQQVNWWQLLKVPFDLRMPVDAFRDPALRLSGKPWAILQRGAMSIPVFRKRKGDRKLYRQHHARLAAYAHLLSKCERTQVPYAIVLFGDGYDGVAVPILPSSDEAFREGLARARQVLADFVENRRRPDAPELESVCRGCPWGRPRVYHPGKSETKIGEIVLEPFLTEGQDGQDYHSNCGDRFRWVPPHHLAEEEGLLD